MRTTPDHACEGVVRRKRKENVLAMLPVKPSAAMFGPGNFRLVGISADTAAFVDSRFRGNDGYGLRGGAVRTSHSRFRGNDALGSGSVSPEEAGMTVRAAAAMRAVLRGLTLLGLVSVCLAPAAAETGVRLDGPRTQGGLLRGQVPPGSTVEYEGEAVRVSRDGWFLVGFGRDAPPDAELVVAFPDGRRRRQQLTVEPRDYDIQRIDGLPPRKVTPRSAEDLARIEADVRMVKQARAIDDPRTDFLSGFRWPATGRISGVYGSQRILNGEPRRPHFGIDIAAPTGTKVVAPADGVITLVHKDMFFSGGTMIVDHGHGLSSAFLHLSRILVERGERVVQGQAIAEVGSTGRSTGPHLDWRINLFGRRLDPALLVGPMPK